MHNARQFALLLYLANTSFVYPFVVIILFYSEWYLAWYILGHRPRPWIDDPKFINGASWLHAINWLLALGSIPVCIASVTLNVAYVAQRYSSVVQIGLRLMTVIGLWLGLFVWMQSDPHGISEWWLD